MTPPDLLLLAGYPVALVVLTRLRSVFRERRTSWFLAEEVASGSIAVGWALKGRPEGAAVNALWAVGLGTAWVMSGRRHLPKPSPPEEEGISPGGAPGTVSDGRRS